MNAPNRRTCRTAACPSKATCQARFRASTLSKSRTDMASRAPMAPAHAMGCPPNVVMCPRDGPWANSPNNDVDVARPPMAIPPPSALPMQRMSGTTSKCVKAHGRPVRPMPHWISSKIRSAPDSEHLARRACNHPLEGIRTPASPCTVSTITHATSESIRWRSPGSFQVRNSTSGNRGR